MNDRSAFPELVVHADWSVRSAKRWRCEVTRMRSGGVTRWRVAPPRRVGPVDAWIDELANRVEREGRVALGLDLPIGLPGAYAQRCGVHDFRELLPRLGRGEWESFFDVAERAEEVSLQRPFYPGKGAAGVRQSQLVEALGLSSPAELLRECDRATTHRNAACSLFWTVGAQQVGKAAIRGWREVVLPLLDRLGERVGLWPFDGEWNALLQARSLVIAETYPAEFYARLGFPRRGWSKRNRDDRRDRSRDLSDWIRGKHIKLSGDLRRFADDGFAARSDGEDAFDGTIGAVGMAACLTGDLPVPEPSGQTTRRVEGWILGREV